MVAYRTIENYRLKKDGVLECVYCGCKNELILNIDHILPLCRGGKDNPDNKQITCITCNQMKGGLTHEEFVEYKDMLLKLFKMRRITIQIGFPTINHVHNLFPLEDTFKYKKVVSDETGRVTPDVKEVTTLGEVK